MMEQGSISFCPGRLTAAWPSRPWSPQRSVCRCLTGWVAEQRAASPIPGCPRGRPSKSAPNSRPERQSWSTVRPAPRAVSPSRSPNISARERSLRPAATLRSLAALSADVTIPLVADEAVIEDKFKEQFAAGVDVVGDYLWGKSAERLLIAAAKAGAEGVPIRFVQIGSVSGPNITLPSAVLRSSAIELMGSGINSISRERFVEAIGGVLQAAIPGGFQIATKTVPLSEVERAWSGDASTRRTVLHVDHRSTCSGVRGVQRRQNRYPGLLARITVCLSYPADAGYPVHSRAAALPMRSGDYWIIRRSLSSGRPLRAGPVGG